MLDAAELLEVILAQLSIHVVVYTSMFGVIVYLLTQKSYKPKTQVVLTQQEMRECVETWSPGPLVPTIVHPEKHALDLESMKVVEKIEGRHITVCGRKMLNASSSDFLGYAHQKGETVDAALDCLANYGPGSCGPRQFYGTLDIHVKFEDKMCEFMGVPAAILYASGLATVTSVIPVFSTRSDYILSDEGCKHSIQVGNYNSRSRVKYFRHNDIEHLDQLMQEVAGKAKKTALKFVVVEGLYQNYGDLCRLPEILALAKKYKFHVLLDDSYGLGTLGATGRGTLEHFGLTMKDIDVYVADVSLAMSSLGGVCCGEHFMVEVQRLNGSGYIFSASNPPYLVASGISSIERLSADPSHATTLQDIASRLHAGLSAIPNATLHGYEKGPVKLLGLAERYQSGDSFEDHKVLQKIVEASAIKGVLCTRAKQSVGQRFEPPPFIKITANRDYTAEDVQLIISTLAESFERVLS